jgi:putative transposase
MLVDRLGISERRACRFAGQNRSTQRYCPQVAEDDAVLRTRLRKLSTEHPRWGYRRAHGHLLTEGWSVNRKRVQRIWREEGLRVPSKTKKRRRLGVSTTAADRLRAEHPNHVWALDFQHDATDDGRELKFLNVVDEFTREALAIEVDRSINAEETVAVLARLAAKRGAPTSIRADNGPELTAAVLREWCRQGKTDTAYIEPGSPWQNPFVESFNSRMRDELLNTEVFTCLEEARVLADDWRQDYNANHPHSALGMMSPERFAASLRSPSGLATRGGGQERYSLQTNPGLSLGVDR